MKHCVLPVDVPESVLEHFIPVTHWSSIPVPATCRCLRCIGRTSGWLYWSELWLMKKWRTQCLHCLFRGYGVSDYNSFFKWIWLKCWVLYL